MPRKEQKKDTGAVRITDEEWARRRLCSDGNCIGVIGAGGRCKECGLPYSGSSAPDADDEALPFDDLEEGDDAFDVETRDDSLEPDSDQSAYADEQDDEAEASSDETDDEVDTETDDEWARRRLCRDGNCIGVIEPNGRCKECGLAWKSGKSGKLGKSD